MFNFEHIFCFAIVWHLVSYLCFFFCIFPQILMIEKNIPSVYILSKAFLEESHLIQEKKKFAQHSKKIQ